MDSGRTLALALARRLDAATPSELRVLAFAEGDAVVIGPVGWVGHVFVRVSDYGGAEVLAESVLDNVQESMIEKIVHGGWPPVDPDQPRARQTGDALPLPNAALEGDVLHLWYGNRERPSLLLAPITEKELQQLDGEAAASDDDLVAELWGDIVGPYLAANRPGGFLASQRAARGLDTLQ